MKRPESYIHSQELTGIQGDSIQIINMREKIKESMPHSEDKKHPFIMVNGKQFPKRWYNPQMAKRKPQTSTSLPISNQWEDKNPTVDQYIVNYEFPAFPNNSLKPRSKTLTKKFNKTYPDQLITQNELKKITKLYRKDHESKRSTLSPNNQNETVHFATTDNIYKILSNNNLRRTYPTRNRPMTSFS